MKYNLLENGTESKLVRAAEGRAEAHDRNFVTVSMFIDRRDGRREIYLVVEIM
jgi:hypothetical protein